MNYNDLYNQRYDKIKDTIAFKNKHATAVYMGSTTPAAEEGMTIAEYLTDPHKTMDLFFHYVGRLNERGQIDGLNTMHPTVQNVPLASRWWSLIKMPGRELPPNSIWQVDEKANIDVSDYDFIIKNGLDAMTQRLLPSLVPDEDLKIFKTAVQERPQIMQRYVDEGYPLLSCGTIAPPFETLCGGRGMNKFYMDCYKIPDKIKETLDVMMVDIRKNIAGMSTEKFMLGVWIGGWRGASNLVNQKIWDTLVWPYIKEIAGLLIAKGITPILHMDACWDRDIARFKELPARSVILNTDGMTDLRKARKILGDHAAFLGDVPVQMLAISSKAEVEEYIRRLIGDIGAQGLLLAPGCDAPSNAKFENMAAIYELAKEF
ncbi:conserved hypothetical protein [Treponema primitia ZAS-2]|uniref:Uroporphyrinogen decarboxylase (URO-D) domain-containing protein n=1 Tax=Treponema primitia (strain ATCC BAA-887 / DSM 12427 / ZAS-2) TaxID=545694 RepID=F5YP95_TREPZ|nr:uroporphyrinogen decarboxylase family protein [Treponema primitia]AEF87044.1 conserved hypothetical protein [Treponema primitia ZAS-2]